MKTFWDVVEGQLASSVRAARELDGGGNTIGDVLRTSTGVLRLRDKMGWKRKNVEPSADE